jgi:hypothetical protein
VPTRTLDDEIDQLYQLPLDEFTAARNALAKTGGAGIKSLAKPPLAAWAVNQLYWRGRKVYAALVESAEAARRVHKAVLGGRGGDLRAADKAHDAAVDAALKSTLEILREDGHPATDATRQAILTTLRALPADDPPGRLTRVLQPGGFEMLSGLSLAAGARLPAAKKAAKAEPAPASPKGKGKADAKAKAAQARLEAAVRSAERTLTGAEHAAKREEFEAARTARTLEKAEQAAKDARAAFDAAREALEEAEAALPPAQRAREAAARRARQADAAVAEARERLDAARAQLDAS